MVGFPSLDSIQHIPESQVLVVYSDLERYSFVMPLTPKSGVLLMGASVAAIAAVGSIFELASGTPDWGTVPTEIILVVSFPLVIVLFIAAVRSASSP